MKKNNFYSLLDIVDRLFVVAVLCSIIVTLPVNFLALGVSAILVFVMRLGSWVITADSWYIPKKIYVYLIFFLYILSSAFYSFLVFVKYSKSLLFYSANWFQSAFVLLYAIVIIVASIFLSIRFAVYMRWDFDYEN